MCVEEEHLFPKSGVTIGKRYARTDEIGVPFAVTVDYATTRDNTVTVRERDSMAQVRSWGVCKRDDTIVLCVQVRVPVPEVPGLLRQLSDMLMTWEAVCQKYPAQAAADEEK